jgi:hypothetical protein
MSRAARGLAGRAGAWPAAVLVSAAWLCPALAPAQPPEGKTIHLKGTVLGRDGQPVPAAEVGVIDPMRFQALDQVFSGKCNQAGEFEIVAPDLTRYFGPRATYCVLARSADGTLMGAETTIAEDIGRPLRTVLQAPGYIHTSILDPKGRPVADIGTLVVVKAEYVPGAVDGPHTNAFGEVVIGPLPAGLRLSVGVAHEFRHLVAQNVWDRKEITLQPGETYELPPLTLEPEGRAVEGTLESADGKPLPGAQVACILPGGTIGAAHADEQGRFRLTRLPVKGYDVWLIAADTAKRLYLMSLVDPDSGEKARLVLRPLTDASGLLAGPDGQILANVRVSVFPMLKARLEGVTAHTMWNTEWVPLPEPVKTAEDGSWQASGLIAGAMYVLQPEVPEARLDFEEGIFEVDRDGKPTDCGLMMMQ